MIDDKVGSPIARVLRGGTLIAVAVVAVGYVLGLVAGDDGPGTTPLLPILASGGADALIGAGLLVLTLVPLVVLGVAAIGFARSGERSDMAASLLTLALLAASLATAILVSTPA